MTFVSRLRTALTTLAAVGCTVFTLGCGLLLGAENAAPYVAAECRGFDALVAPGDGLPCDHQEKVGASGAASGLFAGLGASATFEFPEA